jgi:hypothetical protein
MNLLKRLICPALSYEICFSPYHCLTLNSITRIKLSKRTTNIRTLYYFLISGVGIL